MSIIIFPSPSVKVRGHEQIKKPSNGPGDGNNAALPSSPSAIHYSLHHPAIVSLLSHFTCASGRFHVLEFCSRGSLEAFLHSREGSRTSEGELRGVGRSLVDALLYLKKERVVHRAICPGNILLTEDLRVVCISHAVSSMAHDLCYLETVRLWPFCTPPHSLFCDFRDL